MRSLTATFDPAKGPIVDVAIGNSYLYELAPGPGGRRPALNRSMLIDTGCQFSVIERNIAKTLRIRTDQAPAPTERSGKEVWREIADVSLAIGNGGHVWTLQFVRLEVEAEAGRYSKHGLAGLIGRDLLKDATLRYVGPSNKFTLEW